jgi:hypothetical protein
MERSRVDQGGCKGGVGQEICRALGWVMCMLPL